MSKIISVVDVEGFVHRGEFRPREVAVYSPSFHMIFEVDPQLARQSPLDFLENSYAKHKFHGLSLSVNSYCPDKEKLLRHLKEVYKLLSDDETCAFGTRNEFMFELL